MESATRTVTAASSRRTRGQLIMTAGFLIILALLVVSVLIWFKSVTYNSEHLLHMSAQQVQSRQLISLRRQAHEHTIALYRAAQSFDPKRIEQVFAEVELMLGLFRAERELIRGSTVSADETAIWTRAESILANAELVRRQVIKHFVEDDPVAAQKLYLERLIPLQEQFISAVNALIEMHQTGVDDDIVVAETANETAYLVVFLLSGIALLLAALMVFTLRRAARTDLALVQQSERIRTLYEVTSVPGRTSEQQIQELLHEGCRLLGTEIAKLCRIDLDRKIVTFIDTYCVS